MRPALLRRGQVALELGCAPGSWTQVLVKHGMRVVGVDLLPVEPVSGWYWCALHLEHAGRPAAVQLCSIATIALTVSWVTPSSRPSDIG